MLDDTILEIPKFLKDHAMKPDNTKSEPKYKMGDTKITKDGWEMKLITNGWWFPVRDTNAVNSNNREEIRKYILNEFKLLPPNTVKKRPFLKLLRRNAPDLNPSSINRQLNNLLKLRALEIDKEYKTKRFVIEGKNFHAHYKKHSSI